MRHSPRPYTIPEMFESAIPQLNICAFAVSVIPSKLLALVQPAKFDCVEQRS